MKSRIFPIYESEDARSTLLKRTPPDESPVLPELLDGIEEIFGERLSPAAAVSKILVSVRTDGDPALHYWSEKLDGTAQDQFRVETPLLTESLESLPSQQKSALFDMAARITNFHRLQPMTSWITQELGGSLGQLIRPIRRVGLYVPSGTAPLPSSVIMSAIPAKVAGVPELVVVSPPMRGTNRISPIILAACAVAGVDEVYMLGGAQAIAALAYGTQSIPAVDKIFGPGNLFVTLAKQQVFGAVGIDGLAGPTETVVIADDHAKPAWVAADLLAQAEHDILASAILITPSLKLAQAVELEISHQIEKLSRSEIVATALANRGGAVITKDLDQAVALSNAYAPEHLCLAVENPWQLSEKVTAAGGIFLGEHSFEVLGDYVAGPSHVMPTGGTARFASPLNVWDFIHIISLVALDPHSAAKIIPTAVELARAEGLDAHARAADIRLR